MFPYDLIIAAHKHSIRHRGIVIKSKVCGCFYCENMFPPTEIADWVDDEQTALCPRCGIDSVLGDQTGFPITDMNFLKAMHRHWFG